MNVPVFANVPVVAEKLFVTRPLPVAVREPELVKNPPLPIARFPLPLHVPLVLLFVKARVSSVTVPAGLSVSTALPGTVVEPLPDCVPPDQVNALSAISAPAPLIVPLASCKLSTCIDVAATVIVPPLTLKSPAPAMSDPLLNVAVPPVRFAAVPVPSVIVPLLANVVGDRASVPLWISIVPLLVTASGKLSANDVVPVPVIFVNVPVFANVPVVAEKLLVTEPLPVAVRDPALVKNPLLPIASVPLPLHVPFVLFVVNARVSSVMVPAGFIVSTALLGTVVDPPPDCVPPDQINAPVSVSAPAPVKVPPDSVKVPPAVETSETVSVPALIVMFSVDCSLPVNCVPLLTVIVGLAAPRSMITVCPATGNPALQFAAVLQFPLESVFQTLTPVKTVPRWKKTVVPTVCVTNASGPPGPVGGSTVENEPDTVPPPVIAIKVSPTFVPLVVNGAR